MCWVTLKFPNLLKLVLMLGKIHTAHKCNTYMHFHTYSYGYCLRVSRIFASTDEIVSSSNVDAHSFSFLMKSKMLSLLLPYIVALDAQEIGLLYDEAFADRTVEKVKMDQLNKICRVLQSFATLMYVRRTFQKVVRVVIKYFLWQL